MDTILTWTQYQQYFMKCGHLDIFNESMTGQKQTRIHQIYCVSLFWNMPLSVRIETLLIDCDSAVGIYIYHLSSCPNQMFGTWYENICS